MKVEIVDSKYRDMLEFDQYVASQGGHLNTNDLDKKQVYQQCFPSPRSCWQPEEAIETDSRRWER
jgi:hypothetical protein